MKTKLRTCMTTVGLGTLLLTIGSTGFSVQAGSQKTGGRIEGTWETRVTIRVCQTSAEIRSFDSVGTINEGGTFLDSTSGTPQALKTPGQGIWEHLGGDTYGIKFKSFSFDAAGNFTGWTIIKHQATLNQAADAYYSAGTAEVYSPNGSLVFTGCSSAVATRMTLN